MSCSFDAELYAFGGGLYVSTLQNVQSENPWEIREKPLALSCFVRSVRSNLQGRQYNAYVCFRKNMASRVRIIFPKRTKRTKYIKNLVISTLFPCTFSCTFLAGRTKLNHRGDINAE